MVAAVAVVVLAWWQLRGQPATTAARGDVTLTLAPVVCVVATTLVVVRLVPVLLRAASRLALRSTGPGAAAVGPAGGPASAPGHGHGADRGRGRGGDVRARAPLDLGALAGRPGRPARGHRPEPRRTHDADRGRRGGRARRGRRAVHRPSRRSSTGRWRSAATSVRRTRRRPWSRSTATWPVTCCAAGSRTAPGAASPSELDPGPAVTGLALADGATPPGADGRRAADHGDRHRRGGGHDRLAAHAHRRAGAAGRPGPPADLERAGRRRAPAGGAGAAPGRAAARGARTSSPRPTWTSR